VLVVAGCGTKPELEARAAAKAWAGSHGFPTDTVRCSSGVGQPFRVRKNDFFCLVHHSPAVCDEIRLDVKNGVWGVKRYRENVDCVLPA
jgi:hypothetical protein